MWHTSLPCCVCLVTVALIESSGLQTVRCSIRPWHGSPRFLWAFGMSFFMESLPEVWSVKKCCGGNAGVLCMLIQVSLSYWRRERLRPICGFYFHQCKSGPETLCKNKLIKFTEEFCRYRWEQDPAVYWDQEGQFLIFVSGILKMCISGCCSSTGILFPSVTEG